MNAVEYEPDKEGNPIIVKSTESEHRSYVRFTNVSRRPVDICWINYTGKPEKYKQLLPMQFLDINTFTSHPWIFKDSMTQERFVINNNQVFRGPPDSPRSTHTTGFRATRGFNYIVRMNWNITAPLRDLKSNAMLAIVELIRDESLVGDLELPRTLELELRQAIVCHRAR